MWDDWWKANRLEVYVAAFALGALVVGYLIALLWRWRNR